MATTIKDAHKAARTLLDDTGVDGLLARQMHDSPSAFKFTDDELLEIERFKRMASPFTAFAETVRIAMDRGFITRR